MPPSDLRTRLERLRPYKARPNPAPNPAAADRGTASRPIRNNLVPPPISDTLPGEVITTALGAFQFIETVYALDFLHGTRRLAELLAHEPVTAGRLARDDSFERSELCTLAFIDTETTGLAGGAGTLVFLVGVGLCQGDNFVLRQYFLTDPNQEEALLTALVDDLAAPTGWVTFNGRAFDMPLLETRLTLNRKRGVLGTRPHLDLLTPARRLYRGRLSSCSLGHLEQHVLHIRREQDDVPGELIPQLYLDYLRTGNPSEMRRVIYHNTVDILSMVTLAAHLLEMFGSDAPNGAARPSLRSPEDWLRLALWHDDGDRAGEAEPAFQKALDGRLPLDDRRIGLRRLAHLLRRLARRAEAAPLWEQMASFTLDDPEAFVELAKHYEWHAVDLPRAEAWAERALALVNGWPAGWRREEARTALRRRLERIQRKRLALSPKKPAKRPTREKVK